VFKRIRNLFIEWIGSGFIRVVASTLRLKIEDESGITASDHGSTPYLFAFWHNRMFLMPYFYRKIFPNRRIVCLVSASQDGEMIARVLHRFGLETARGSSSRRSREAYRELSEYLKEGWDIAITPDGPRGPAFRAQAGVAALALEAFCKLIPITYHVSRKIELPSWDRFIIPLPFSTCVLHFAKPISLDDQTSIEEITRQLEGELNRISKVV
jgi:lysophospholipid acyltransferase (LPLAT)-like uncharacterized protein